MIGLNMTIEIINVRSNVAEHRSDNAMRRGRTEETQQRNSF